ncbi:hypothetical protein [Rubrivivax gelatinosus]|uniref:hypothetical protein n=1 Tax=Rubrivivax gelatinosus TaxID=28068 RepID=UPI001908AC73|nr:hypothetical protein [Rubrivivax gelatinosus]
MDDDRDAWLDDVRRWLHGGTPPAEPQKPSIPAEPAPQCAGGQPNPEPIRKETR